MKYSKLLFCVLMCVWFIPLQQMPVAFWSLCSVSFSSSTVHINLIYNDFLLEIGLFVSC